MNVAKFRALWATLFATGECWEKCYPAVSTAQNETVVVPLRFAQRALPPLGVQNYQLKIGLSSFTLPQRGKTEGTRTESLRGQKIHF